MKFSLFDWKFSQFWTNFSPDCLNFVIVLCVYNVCACSMTVINKFVKLWNRVKDPIRSPDEREAKANEVEPLAIDFVNRYKAWTSDEKVTWYMHCCVHHLSEQIRVCPIDISIWLMAQVLSM